MAKRNVFYSFHFDNDVFRVQQIRNMGIIDGDQPVSPNTWEQLKNTAHGVENWIANNMAGKSCVIVLIGTDTYKRPWVKYEINKAVADGKSLFGIHVHNLKDPKTGACAKGTNPLAGITFKRRGQILVPKVYDPVANDAYGEISRNLSGWVEAAINQ